MLSEVKGLAKGIGIKLEFEPSAIELLANKSYDKIYGARPLRRTIMSLIENPLSKKILDNEINEGSSVLVKSDDDEIVLTRV